MVYNLAGGRCNPPIQYKCIKMCTTNWYCIAGPIYCLHLQLLNGETNLFIFINGYIGVSDGLRSADRLTHWAPPSAVCESVMSRDGYISSRLRCIMGYAAIERGTPVFKSKLTNVIYYSVKPVLWLSHPLVGTMFASW